MDEFIDALFGSEALGDPSPNKYVKACVNVLLHAAWDKQDQHARSVKAKIDVIKEKVQQQWDAAAEEGLSADVRNDRCKVLGKSIMKLRGLYKEIPTVPFTQASDAAEEELQSLEDALGYPDGELSCCRLFLYESNKWL